MAETTQPSTARRRPKLPPRSKSKAYGLRQTTLHSSEAQDIYKRQFRITAYDLVYISVVARLKGESEIADSVEAEFVQWLDATGKRFRGERDRLEAIMDHAGLDASGVSYTDPLEVQARITSPLAGRFFGLIEQLDTVIRYLDLCWVNAEIESSAKTNLMREWKKNLEKVGNKIHTTANMARKRVRESGQDSEADAVAREESGIDLDDGDGDGDGDGEVANSAKSQKPASKKEENQVA